MQIWKLNNNKWQHNVVITKNNGKIWYLTLASIKFDPDNLKLGEMIVYIEFQKI